MHPAVCVQMHETLADLLHIVHNLNKGHPTLPGNPVLVGAYNQIKAHRRDALHDHTWSMILILCLEERDHGNDVLVRLFLEGLQDTDLVTIVPGAVFLSPGLRVKHHNRSFALPGAVDLLLSTAHIHWPWLINVSLLVAYSIEFYVKGRELLQQTLRKARTRLSHKAEQKPVQGISQGTAQPVKKFPPSLVTFDQRFQGIKWLMSLRE
mmetsp:Transcript_22666/g.50125  ORF Transcript_22666/g.50125 Transcript_22666/m.50125 type:complete len:208 (+) Transcript_22666:476-1099(+)